MTTEQCSWSWWWWPFTYRNYEKKWMRSLCSAGRPCNEYWCWIFFFLYIDIVCMSVGWLVGCRILDFGFIPIHLAIHWNPNSIDCMSIIFFALFSDMFSFIIHFFFCVNKIKFFAFWVVIYFFFVFINICHDWNFDIYMMMAAISIVVEKNRRSCQN